MRLPFLNRDKTRRACEHFDNRLDLEPDAARVLAVNGPPGSGKSFTSEFLRLLVGLRAEQHQVIEVDVKAWTGQLLTPGLLVVELIGGMAPEDTRAAVKAQAADTVPRLDNERPERWAKQLVIWLVNRANETGKTWYIVLDSFSKPGVPESTHVFIKQLAVSLAGLALAWDVLDPDMGPPLRLVLLDYPDVPPAPNNGRLRIEEIQPVTTDSLKTHFQRYYRYKGWQVDEDAIQQIVARYEPKLAAMFPQEPAPGEETVRWRLDKLAELVLQDCAMQETLRQAAAAPGGSGNG
jgi:hypothetical protein